MLLVLGAGAMLALWIDHRTSTVLPMPTGPFAVSRASYSWSQHASSTRELLVWIWYPAAATQSAPVREEYLPVPARAAVESFRGVLVSKFLTRDLSKVHVHSIRNAEVAPNQRSYPVAIMRAGASAGVTDYSTLAEDLASHGYIVVGFDAPYRTSVVAFPDGRVMRRTPQNNPELCAGRPDQEPCANALLTAWTADMAFVLDRLAQWNALDPSGKFTGRLDMNRVGVFGHSFGGAAAAFFCHQYARCKAGIDIDGAPHGSVIQAGIELPFLFLLGDHGQASSAEDRQVLADIQSIYDRLPSDTRLRLKIRGANHFLFSDDGALLKSHLVMHTLRALGIVGIDGSRQLAITAYCVRSFFDAHLKGTANSGLKNISSLYPEVQVLE